MSGEAIAMIVLASLCLAPVFQAWRESRRRRRLMRAFQRPVATTEAPIEAQKPKRRPMRWGKSR